MDNFDEHKDLTKFEKQFLSELLNDIEKRENSIWSKPWSFTENQNAFSGHKYSGMNYLFLQLLSMSRNYDDPRFATFNQAKENNYHIQKGSKGIPIQFFTFINKETRKAWNEKEFQEKTKNMTPEQIKKERTKKVAMVKMFHVFNAKNIISNENKLSLSENKPLMTFNKKVATDERIDEFEKTLIKNMGIGFQEKHSDSAFYIPTDDKIIMPLQEQFDSYEARMTTLLHELSHATGHEKRLNRQIENEFGSDDYAKEELKAEMNSVFIVNTLGINLSDNQKENHLLYLDSWGKKIENEPKEFLYALQDSLKIKEYMIEEGQFKDIFLEKDMNFLKQDNKEIQEVSIEELQQGVNLWADEKSLGVVSLLAKDEDKNIFIALDNKDNNCNVEEFSNKEISIGWLNSDIELEELSNFSSSLEIFQDKEFGNSELPEEERYNGKIKDLNDSIMPIAYTEMEDSFDLLEYNKQVSYDLINRKQISITENEYLSLQKDIDIPITDFSYDLENASFDDFISDEGMKIDRDDMTELIILIAYTEDSKYIDLYAEEHNLKPIYCEKENIIANKEVLLKNIDKEIPNIFEKYNVSVTDSYENEKEYKHLIGFQISHYEKVEENNLNNNKEIVYYKDIDIQDSKELYSSYKDLWENHFKNDFVDTLNKFTPNELKHDENLIKSPNLLKKLSKNNKDIDNIINKAKSDKKSVKELDLDNDGVTDRIDADDTRSVIKTEADKSLVGNMTDKQQKTKKRGGR